MPKFLTKKLLNNLGLVSFPVIAIGLILVLAGGFVLYSLKNNPAKKAETKFQNPKKIILLTSADLQLAGVDGFKSELKNLGYVDGKDVSLQLFNAKSDSKMVTEIAEDAVAANPDLIVVFSTSETSALLKARGDKPVPVVFIDVGNFKETGVTDLTHPGHHISGVVVTSVQFGGKRMEILKELLPDVKTVGFLADPKHVNFSADKQVVEQTAKDLNIKLISYYVSNKTEVDKAIAQIIKDHPDALMLGVETAISDQSKVIAKAMRDAKIPTVDHNAEKGVYDGYLIMFGLYRSEAGVMGAKIVDKVLKGQDPGDIPIDALSTLNLEINQTAAKDIGITIPKSLLLKAKKIYTEK